MTLFICFYPKPEASFIEAYDLNMEALGRGVIKFGAAMGLVDVSIGHEE